MKRKIFTMAVMMLGLGFLGCVKDNPISSDELYLPAGIYPFKEAVAVFVEACDSAWAYYERDSTFNLIPCLISAEQEEELMVYWRKNSQPGFGWTGDSYEWVDGLWVKTGVDP